MLRTLRIVATLLILIGMTGSSLAGIGEAAPKASWTVMVYMSGDNNLERYISSDLETELAVPGSSASVQVTALADRGPGYDRSHGNWRSTKLFHVTPGMTALPGSAVADWGERDMGNPRTLAKFVRWSKAHYPADHYALIFWGHGWSWHPGYVMGDDTSDSALDYHEMRPIMNDLGFIDVVGYDGCNMASIEIQSLWHGHATVLAASQEWVGGEGIQYDGVLDQLAADPAMTADELGAAIAASADKDKTFSAVAVDGRWRALRTAVNEFGVALRHGAATHRRDMAKAFSETRSFWQAPIDKDLYDMASEIDARVDGAHIRSKARAVMSAMEPVVLYERHARRYADAHGITIFHIDTASEKTKPWVDWAYYPRTDWAAQTRWDAFLNAWAI